MDLGRRITEQREKRGVSQETLAETLKVSHQTVLKWESGISTPSIDNLLKLSEVLGVSLEYLLKGNQDDGFSPSKQNESELKESEESAVQEYPYVPDIPEWSSPSKTRKNGKTTFAILAVMIIAVVACLIIFNPQWIEKMNKHAQYRHDNEDTDNKGNIVATEIPAASSSEEQGKTSQTDFAKLAQSVLYLEVYDDNDILIATASGFVIDDGLTLVTNYHVIEDAYKLVVMNSGGDKRSTCSKLLAYDAISDLAVLRLDKHLDVEPLVLDKDPSVSQGDAIYAVGYPLGLTNTLSNGIISSVYEDDNGIDIVQITAPISKGSSGGAVLNESGDVIGVICASFERGQNLNVSISVAELNALVKTIPESAAVLLSVRYNEMKTYRYGTSNFNLSNGLVTENRDFVFYVKETYDGGDAGELISSSITQFQKSNRSCLEFQLEDNDLNIYRSLNVYDGKLYYYCVNQDTIFSCEIGSYLGKNNTPVLQLDPKTWVSEMLVAEDMLILHLYSTDNPDDGWIAAYDLFTDEEPVIIEDIEGFSYHDESFYFLSKQELIVVNMLTVESRRIKTPVSFCCIEPTTDGFVFTQGYSNKSLMSYYYHIGSDQFVLFESVHGVRGCKDGSILYNNVENEEFSTYIVSNGQKTALRSQVYPIELLYSYILNYNDSIDELGWKKGSVIGFYRLNSTGWAIDIADAFYEGPDGSQNESAHDDPSDYLAVTINDLFHDPKNYDGCLVKVSAWVGCYAYTGGLSAEEFEEVMLISDQDYLQKEDEEVYHDHELLFGRYYNKIIRQNHVPYAVAVIKPERLTEIPEAVNVEMTVYGKFTYHPELDRDSIYDGRFPYQIEVYLYSIDG